ncbi:MAG TPA: M23 family metallopeptidase [Sphingorhabdus sp.]|nr:M23 family metallopeptidase [Sphingorhabdus sp.]
MAQATPSLDVQQEALRDAKAKALAAERRSELLRQEASDAENAVDRIVAQRAVLSAEIAAAEAQIEAANARIAIISRRQRAQRSRLGEESEPMLRLNAALQQMTSRPTALMIAQPGQRDDYIHLRAVMATVQPEIVRRTGALRRQIAVQNELRAQELIALKSLGDARSRLQSRRTALTRLEGDARGKAGDLSADAAIEFEQAIAQGERARDIVGRIDDLRMSSEKAGELAALEGPMLRRSAVSRPTTNTAYMLPAKGSIVSGYHELNPTGYRERGIRLALDPSTPVMAPAAGKVSFAGRYRSYGQIVIIEHGNGWNTLITNLDAIQVRQGASVAQGAVLGSSGEEAAEIGVELRKNGRVMDIAALLG